MARERDRVWGSMLFEEQTQENISSDALEVRQRASRGNRILEVEPGAGRQDLVSDSGYTSSSF